MKDSDLGLPLEEWLVLGWKEKGPWVIEPVETTPVPWQRESLRSHEGDSPLSPCAHSSPCQEYSLKPLGPYHPFSC